MSERVEVCTAEELPEGERTVVEAAGREIAVIHKGGDLYGILNTCAHMGGPLCDGHVHGALVGEYTGPGERVVESYSDDLAIACPWHGWEYDLASGEHLGDDDIVLPTYDVVEDGGTIYVEL